MGIARVGGRREDAPATREAEKIPEKPGGAKQKPGRGESEGQKPGPQSEEKERWRRQGERRGQQEGQTDDNYDPDPAAVGGLPGGAADGDGDRQGEANLRRQEQRALRAGVQGRRHLRASSVLQGAHHDRM